MNVRRAMQAADHLLAVGLIPFVPHLNAAWHMVSPKDYETWMQWDDAWLSRCDALLRLPGPSDGADQEMVRAQEMGLPVYLSIPDLMDALAAARTLEGE